MKPSVSQAEFTIMVKQTGLPLSMEQTGMLYDAYSILEAMIARVNKPMPREIEPAHTFTAEVK
jgi:diketogulonate reductase-like aldo/keto reductase